MAMAAKIAAEGRSVDKHIIKSWCAPKTTLLSEDSATVVDLPSELISTHLSGAKGETLPPGDGLLYVSKASLVDVTVMISWVGSVVVIFLHIPGQWIALFCHVKDETDREYIK